MMLIRGRLEDLVRNLTKENVRLRRELAVLHQEHKQAVGQARELELTLERRA